MSQSDSTTTPEVTPSSSGTPVPPDATTTETAAPVVTTAEASTATEVVTTSDSTAAAPLTVTDSVEATPTVAPAAPADVAAQLARRQLLTQYGIAFVIVLIMGGGLWYVLEQQGRVDTKVFESVKSIVMPAPAAMIVNGERISRELYDKNYAQLSTQAASQGLDAASPEVAAEIKQQSIDIVVNSELLRQAAVAGGVVVTDEQIQGRYDEIVASQGGVEQLMARMTELGITEEGLLADIENEILIQTHLSAAVDTTGLAVTEEEIKALYDSIASGQSVEVPPLEEVRAQVEQEIRYGKEQELISEYINKLKETAEIEVLI